MDSLEFNQSVTCRKSEETCGVASDTCSCRVSSWKDAGGGGRDHHSCHSNLLSEEEPEKLLVLGVVFGVVCVEFANCCFGSILE